jgi:hypothetical protein
MNQIAANHVASGVRVRRKIVPAVTEVCSQQSAHIRRDFAVSHARSDPQPGQANPSGHLKPAKYLKHDS